MGTVCGVIAKFSPLLRSDILLSCSLLPETLPISSLFRLALLVFPFNLQSDPFFYVVRLLGTICRSERPQWST